MPVAGGGGVGGNRQTFRPPWVREGPPPIPMPSQPWVKSTRTQGPPADTKDAAGVVSSALRKASDAGRKTSTVTIIPTQPKEEKTPEPAVKPSAAARKISEPTPMLTPPEPSRKISEPAKPTQKATENPTTRVPAKTVDKPVEKVVKVAVETKREKQVENAIPIERTASRPRVLERSRTSDKYEGLAVAPKPPAPPPMPPPPPPLPKTSDMLPDKAQLTRAQADKIEALRSRPKRRPDWANMMKEIETVRKLSHVVTNDRSAPLLPMVKAKGQFVYESERPNLHNQLLKQIAGGIQLKPVKTNDRSKPFIEGLRKFRRQMTIEEQIQKSTSMATMGIKEVEPDPLDEVDDIDKVRDDLQSTKQLLAMELKNKEALERENKKLLTRILNMEVDLEKEKNRVNNNTPEDRQEIKKEMDQMSKDLEKSRRLADEMETKYLDTSAKLDLVKLDLDEAVSKSQRLEKQLRVAQAANLAHTGQTLSKQPSAKKIVHQNKSTTSIDGAGDSDETEDESEEESEEETEDESDGGDAEDAQAAAERRQARELKLLQTKLKSFKDKRVTAKKERKSLKEQTAKLQKSLKSEKAKYKVLQKEVDKMSKLMNEGDDDEEEEEEDEEEDEETESESEESEESESEESEGDIPESEPPEKRKANFQSRVKRYENLLSSLKKGNYLLKANVDRFKDELNKQKEMALTLQEDLNSVLAELG